jgi:Na+/melibiose symporter-like transporter
MACPLASAVYTNVLTRAIEASGSFPLVYGIWGVIVLVLGVITYPMLNRFPETFGFQPDGIHRSDEELSAMKQAAETEGGWPLKRLFTTPETYFLMIGWACMFWIMTGFMSIFVPRMLELGIPIFTAVNYLSMASILGIFLSYAWGWIDDRFGAHKASIGLGCGYLLMSLAMWFASNGNQVLIIIAVIGVACATGGLPNLNPSSIAYVYGRNDFMPNLRWIMLVAGGLSAPAVVIFGMIKDKYGNFDSVYLLCSILGVIAILSFALIKRSYDPDRKAI